MSKLPDNVGGINCCTKEDTAKANLEKLHRMVLGKDENINEEYIQKFYADMAKEVNNVTVF